MTYHAPMTSVEPLGQRVLKASFRAPTLKLSAWCAAAAALVALPAMAQTNQLNYTTPYTITTFAGTAYVGADVDGTGSAAQFYEPSGVAIDASGNIYVADEANNVVRKITGGVTTTFAGLPGKDGVGVADGTGSAARFVAPFGITCDPQGNVYVADVGSSAIRKITPAGVVTTIAGLPLTTGNTDGTGTAALFNEPTGIVVGQDGNLYVADELNSSIRQVTTAGVVKTVAGVSGAPGIADGTGSIAKFNQPYGIAVDSSGNFYIADTYNYEIRKMTPSFTVTTIAGKSKNPGDVDATGSNAKFKYPTGVAVDGSGNIYVADYENYTIREINPSTFAVTTYVGTGGVVGFANGTGPAAQFEGSLGIAATSNGTLYVADTNSDLIKEVAPGAVVTTLAGQPFSGFLDGTGSAAQFDNPTGVAVDASGNIYVVDEFNDIIRKITPAGVTTTLAGTPGDNGSSDGTGPAAQFDSPTGIAVDSLGNVYVTDSGNDTLRKITSAGVVTTFVGQAKNAGTTNGTGTGALLNNPAGVAVDSSNNIYVSEAGNYDIRKITPSGVVTTLAGAAGSIGTKDGTGSAASFGGPDGMAVDSSGNVYVCDYGSDTIRKITAAGAVTTIAGTAGVPGAIDGTGTAASFYSPSGITIDSKGNLFIADQSNDLIRMMSPAGVVSTLAGQPYSTTVVDGETVAVGQGSADGTGSAATFWKPNGIAVDSSGNLFIADTANSTIRKGYYSTSPVVATQPSDQFVTPGGSATFTVTATGAGTLTYQWNFNGTAISGATSASYTVSNAQAASAGQYTVTITNSEGSTTSNAANLYVNLATAGPRLVNISTRAEVGTGGNILIPGFVIGGSGTETLLIRADGPVLTSFGLSGVLATPTLTVTSQSGTVLATNTGWGTNPNPTEIANVSASVGAFALPSGSADCALIITLPAGAYTVQVAGVGGTTGVALAEIYEVSSSGTRLVNISTRGEDGTGANVIIPGFVVASQSGGTEQVLVRADGPVLTSFGLSGVLLNPSLTVTNQAGTVIASNTGWGTSTNPTPAELATIFGEVGAFALPDNSADSAADVTLSPGAYTFQVAGVNNTTGIALAEVYEVPASN